MNLIWAIYLLMYVYTFVCRTLLELAFIFIWKFFKVKKFGLKNDKEGLIKM
jgi:hypothetical protein